MKRILLIGALAALLPVLASAQDATPILSASPVASPVASDVGKTVRIGDWSVTLIFASFSSTVAPDWYEPVKARGTFLTVRLSVVNESSQPAYFAYEEAFRVRDSRGREFSKDTDATYALLSDEGMEDGWLQPGITYDQVLVFDVAPDATGFVLTVVEDASVAIVLGV